MIGKRSINVLAAAIFCVAPRSYAATTELEAAVVGMESLRGALQSLARRLTGRPASLPREQRLNAGPAAGEEEKRLAQAMKSDLFHTARAFPQDLEPITQALRRGVKSFSRTIYRTTENVRSWNSGYDMVRYEILHTDSSQSIIDAFRRAETPFEVMLGGADLRPLFHSLSLSAGNGRMLGYLYRNGTLKQQGELSEQEGLAMTRSFIEDSIRNGGLTRIDRPEAIVVLPRQPGR